MYTVRSRLSELRLTGIPAIRHKTARNGFLSMHFTMGGGTFSKVGGTSAPQKKY